MSKVLVTSLLLLALAPALNAGPPKRPAERMVFDEVGAALDRYRMESDEGRRLACLRRLAPTRDPRVAVELGEAGLFFNLREMRRTARRLLFDYYIPPGTLTEESDGFDWYLAHRDELYRRAKQLPQ